LKLGQAYNLPSFRVIFTRVLVKPMSDGHLLEMKDFKTILNKTRRNPTRRLAGFFVLM
jgi:hypothetical protein